jgi:hypothetical protein
MLIFQLDIEMRQKLLSSAALCVGLVFIHGLTAQASAVVQQYPELAPLSLSERLAAAREPLPVENSVDAALEFSGASDPGAAAAKDKLVTLLRRFRDEVADVTSAGELAEKALTFLHRNLFTTYSFLQTRVDTALDTGVYNCVSSAVLYTIVARSVGLSVSGVRTRDHAFCSVLVNGQQIDVETTNPFGFNPGAKKEFSDSFGKTTGYSYVPPGNYADRRTIGEKELLSLILYDRVAEYGDARLYHDALQPAVSAYALMGNDETRQVMTVAFSNYLTSLGMRNDFTQAVQFMDAVKASFGGIVDMGKPRRDLYHNWVVSLLDSNALQDADALLIQPATKSSMDDADWTNLSIAVTQRRAQAEATTGGFVSAAAIVLDSIQRLGRLPLLLQTYEAFIHNGFAQLYNAHKYAEARVVIEQGITSYGESRIFQQDLDLLKNAAKQ